MNNQLLFFDCAPQISHRASSVSVCQFCPVLLGLSINSAAAAWKCNLSPNFHLTRQNSTDLMVSRLRMLGKRESHHAGTLRGREGEIESFAWFGRAWCPNLILLRLLEPWHSLGGFLGEVWSRCVCVVLAYFGKLKF